MMGHQSRSESLFYYFRLEDQVPENHLLRLIDRHVNFDFIRAKLKDSYSDTGRPSIDPELLLRLLLVGYLYGVTSERKLVEELRMHLAWRWFTGLGFDQEIPHHSTFSKNRHGRFQESNLFQALAQLSLFHSPFTESMSEIEMLQQLSSAADRANPQLVQMVVEALYSHRPRNLKESNSKKGRPSMRLN